MRPLLLLALLLLACEPAPTSPKPAADAAPVVAPDAEKPTPIMGLSGTVTELEGEGLSLTLGEGAATPLKAGATIPSGATLTTSGDTRARIALSEGGLLVLNHSTRVTLRKDAPKALKLEDGHILVDFAEPAIAAPSDPAALKLAVAPPDAGAPKAIAPTVSPSVALPTGEVALLGTKVSLVAGAQESLATVLRGRVRVSGQEGSVIEAGPGTEVRLSLGQAPVALAAPDLGQAGALDGLGEPTPAVPRGLGSLTAREPGRTQDAPLEKTAQQVDITLRGPLAYTEITETFKNPTGQTLEGTYRFPLPDGASIQRLSLLVNGQWQEGAFVENARAEFIFKTVIAQWRDPALLRWRHGDQFELRIFPIPPYGERTVRIGYATRLSPTADARRYTYPMPIDHKITAQRFTVRARIFGAAGPARVGGYPLQSVQQGCSEECRDDSRAPPQRPTEPYLSTVTEEARRQAGRRPAEPLQETLAFAADRFMATGDLTLDVPLGDAPLLSALAFIPTPDQLPPGEPGFAVLTLKPALPPATEVGARDLVVLVDRSYSRTGVAFELQADLLARMMAELDPLDRISVFACNERCEPVGAPGFQSPTQAGGADLRARLKALRPEGGTNLVEAVRVAAALLERRPADQQGRAARVLLFTDGIASVGPLEPADLELGVKVALANLPDARLTLADLGGDRDGQALAALARGGRGVQVALIPGESLSAQALRLLGAQYGALLTDVALSLPVGFEQVYPTALPAIPAGGELVVAARMIGVPQGDVILSGQLAGKPFQVAAPLHLTPTSTPADALAAKLWAEAKIQALEAQDPETFRPAIIELSQTYGVLSRHTSLLALESDAMRQAFGVERTRALKVDLSAAGPTKLAVPTVPTDALYKIGDKGAADAPKTSAPKPSAEPSPAPAQPAAAEGSPMPDRAADPFRETKRPVARAAAAPIEEESEPTEARGEVGGGRMAPAKAKKAEASLDALSDGDDSGLAGYSGIGRAGSLPDPFPGKRARPATDIRTPKPVGARERARAERARVALAEEPLSVTRNKAAVRAFSAADDLASAEALASAWLARDPMDAEALVLKAEIATREGDPELAERLLASAADVAPRAPWLRKRLASAYDALDEPALACAHRISLESLELKRPVGAGLGCPLASDLSFLGLPPPAESFRPDAGRLGGALELTLTWEGEADLDLGLLSPSERYSSWMGGEPSLRLGPVVGVGLERLSVEARSGLWKVGVTRRSPGDEPIRGTLEIRAPGRVSRLPFVLTGERLWVASVQLSSPLSLY